ncbi:hypothetical protein Ciccas_004551 [Cichlidogyrus casuarinus]|uniref:Ig-like domain-containing protein n=1 Tax=Cichlidogyrus casuarinus TaxID=1844966 RepID=A0ABD2QC16_9PLAT
MYRLRVEPVRPRIQGGIRTERDVSRGETLKLQVEYSGTPAPDVTWFRNGRSDFAPGRAHVSSWGARSTLQIRDFDNKTDAVISSYVGSFLREFAPVLMTGPRSHTPPPPSFSPFLLEPDNYRVRNGDLVRFSCLLKPDVVREGANIRWLFNDRELHDGDNLFGARIRTFRDYPTIGAHQLELDPVSASNSGRYQINISTQGGTKQSTCNNWLEVDRKS